MFNERGVLNMNILSGAKDLSTIPAAAERSA
jgi:hypothetical protein